MTAAPYDLVVLGLSLSSSWGNGHATTFRALLAGLERLGKRILFLERDVPWYAENRDLPDPPFCRLAFYASLEDLDRYRPEIAAAEMVLIGSYVPDGIAVIDKVLAAATGRVAFYDIDTPVTLAALDEEGAPFLDRRQIPAFDLYFSFTGGPTLDRLERAYGARRAVALYCSVEEARYRPTGEPYDWDLGYLGTYSPDRQPTLEALLIEPARRLPDRRFVVAGPQYPDHIDWPANVERIEHLAPADHASFYSRQRFTLNVTRADMIRAGWSPSVRLFEAAACAVPIISDRWAGLGDVLPEGRAILPVDDGDAVVEHLTRMAEDQRRRVGARGRAAVLASHTGLARAVEFIRALASLDRETRRQSSADAA
ncbi:CgeB family protein [Prosthecomicrobium sp. N25]|uniref:CgeB family protein n=1 Tax=Prosthecomicrobium sp. N25 TaxID=3129254 RepID=UPI0030776178